MTRAKFVCSKSDEGGQIVLEAVVGGSEENDKFFEATPTGSISLCVLNKNVTFEEGKEYYVDFTEA